MHAVKAHYRSGNIQLLSPLPAVDEAELLIVVLDREDGTSVPAETLRPSPCDSEEEFRALGLASFANDNADQHIDWEEVFDVQSR
jgi:hypothetical protein